MAKTPFLAILAKNRRMSMVIFGQKSKMTKLSFLTFDLKLDRVWVKMAIFGAFLQNAKIGVEMVSTNSGRKRYQSIGFR